VFFIDFAGHIEDAPVAAVIEQLTAEVADLKVLGSYPRAVL
jgi:chorismate mutase/prephenate dehydratase